jgi:hypothetical protein
MPQISTKYIVPLLEIHQNSLILLMDYELAIYGVQLQMQNIALFKLKFACVPVDSGITMRKDPPI